MAPLDPNIIQEFLSVLEDRNIYRFKCELFEVVYFAEEDDDEDSQPISTDVRGFIAPSESDDEEDDAEDLRRQHQRAFGAPMPLLMPRSKPKKD